jgi:hypothetical protein
MKRASRGIATPTTNRVSRISYLSKHSVIVASPRRFDQRLGIFCFNGAKQKGALEVTSWWRLEEFETAS